MKDNYCGVETFPLLCFSDKVMRVSLKLKFESAAF